MTPAANTLATVGQELELLDLWGRAIGLDESSRHEEAIDALAVRARGPVPSRVAAVVTAELAHQTLEALTGDVRRHEAGREQAALTAAWSRMKHFDDPEALHRHNQTVWTKLWRQHHLERGVTAAAIPPAPLYNRAYNRLDELRAGGELACHCSPEACSCRTTDPLRERAVEALRATAARSPGTASERLAAALAEAIGDAVLQAVPEPSEPVQPLTFKIDKLVVGDERPPAPPPVVNVPAPIVNVPAPDVTVNVEQPRARAVRVEEDPETGERIYRTIEEEGQ